METRRKINRPYYLALAGRLSYVLFFSFTFSILNAQLKDTATIKLNEIVIHSSKAEKFTAGKKIQKIDSATLKHFNNTNLGDLLSINTPVFIKNYGPGNLSSSGFRGGNASQTAILWNGINIQNPMLGQNDLSQLPNFIFDNVSIDYGGSSALWGSGAMGGSINLNNRSKFNGGLNTSLNVGFGSFNTRKLNSNIQYSNSKFSSNTKVYLNASDNNYSYLDTTVKTMKHSNYQQKGFMQELSFVFLDHHQINARAWYHQSDRNFAPPLNKTISKASQADENFKMMLDWNYQKKNFSPSVKLAYFNDQLNYTDSIAALFSKNKTRTFVGEAETFYKINVHHQLFAGINFTNYEANSNNYIPNTKQYNKTAFMLGYSNHLFENKLVSNINIRQEISNTIIIPLTGNVGISYNLFKPITFKVNAAKVYRQPTLNDLYWPVTGNPNLKAEEGYTYDAGLEIKFAIKKISIQSEITYFGKQIDNWINWVPGPGGNAAPMNVSKVYSRGGETSSSVNYSNKKLNLKLGFNSAYVLSTSLQSALVNDASVNKQLIYTPRYNYGAQFMFRYDNFSLFYFHNYIGYRYSTSDNSSWLKPYDVGNLKVSYLFKMESVNFITAFQINNIYNTSYFVIDKRPMPLRSYEVSITLTYHKPNKNK